MKNICLTHTSMQEALAHTLAGSEFQDVPQLFGRDPDARLLCLPSQAPSLTQSEAEHLCERFGLTLPIHTLVSCASARRQNQLLICHVWSGDSLGQKFPRMLHGVQTIPLELYYLQQSAQQSFLENLLLGYDLCSNYLKRPGYETLYDQQQLLSCADLERFLVLARCEPGVKAVKRVLPYLSDNSRSPKESELAIRLALPRALGGDNVGVPLMNHTIQLSPEAADALGQKVCMLDLYYPSLNLAIEYNGAEYHPNQSKDITRQLALASMGIELVYVTHEHLSNQAKYDLLIRDIFKRAHKRQRCRSERYSTERDRLVAFFKNQ